MSIVFVASRLTVDPKPAHIEERWSQSLLSQIRGGQAVHSDFTVFHAHLAEACRHRKKTPDPLCAAAVDLHFAGVRALDVYRLAKIADELDVSVDWLLGRSDMMEIPQHPG